MVIFLAGNSKLLLSMALRTRSLLSFTAIKEMLVRLDFHH
jgi:hypothetical protein